MYVNHPTINRTAFSHQNRFYRYYRVKQEKPRATKITPNNRVLLFSAPCYRVLSILPGATNFGCVLPRTVLSLGGTGRPATAGYRVLLFCGLCYRVLLFSAAFGLSATACYRVLSRSLPRATAFATACYRVCYRVLPGAIACYNCKCDRRPICGAKRESRGRARSAGRARGSRIQNPKKKTQKTFWFS